MSTLIISVKLLTGRYVAAEVSDRDKPEWPPHPGRLFMALAATCFERGSVDDEVAAIQWLEGLDPPEIFCGEPAERSLTTCYVPTNDKNVVSTAILQTTPGLTRSKQARSFPTVIAVDDQVDFVWKQLETEPTPSQISSLQKVCEETIRIGHSSSLVSAKASIVDDLDSELSRKDQHWQPTDRNGQRKLRVASAGEFSRLRTTGARDQIEEFFELHEMCQTGSAASKREAKERFLERFGVKYGKNLRPPEPAPAVISNWQAYDLGSDYDHRAEVRQQQSFDSDLIVLCQMDGPKLAIAETLAVSGMLRSAVMKHCGIQPAPSWISGHDDDDSPTKDQHVAFLPLPYVGDQYADGHLLGYAIAVPSNAPSEQLKPGLSPVFYQEDGSPKEIELKLGVLGIWKLSLEQRTKPPRALSNSSWTSPSREWSSVTPVVLDRFPKTDRRKRPDKWREEVASIVRRSCQFSGIPEPESIDIDTTAFLSGVPRATKKKLPPNSRRVRQTTGTGFPPMTTSPGKPPRPQVHVKLAFAEPVSGPVLVGAGRFLGYGVFKPALSRKGSAS